MYASPIVATAQTISVLITHHIEILTQFLDRFARWVDFYALMAAGGAAVTRDRHCGRLALPRSRSGISPCGQVRPAES
jgi:hypothetical protein